MGRTAEECLAYLEEIRWQGVPQCPYCQSFNSTIVKKEKRYHCNRCFNSYSVTVNTIFHNTHVPLDKWFNLIHLLINSSKKPSVRQVAKELKVAKNTAMRMISNTQSATDEEQELLHLIAGFWLKNE